MSVMFILIGCSLILAIGFLAAFIWSVKSGQMDDDYTPSVRILFDDFELKSTKSIKMEDVDQVTPRVLVGNEESMQLAMKKEASGC